MPICTEFPSGERHGVPQRGTYVQGILIYNKRYAFIISYIDIFANPFSDFIFGVKNQNI